MFSNNFLVRLVLRLIVLGFNLVSPLSFIYVLLAYLCYPAPPLIILFGSTSDSIDNLYAFHGFAQFVLAYTALECVWRILHGVGRGLIGRGVWDFKGEQEGLGTEERWRTWVKLLESSQDPWSWLGGWFLAPGQKTAKRGMADPAVSSVRMEEVGRKNVQEFIAHYLFGKPLESIKTKGLERDELRSMLILLELAISNSRGPNADFQFPRGKSKHKPFLISREPVVTAHHPLIFYLIVWLASALGNTALWWGGFKYYGNASMSTFPLFFMRGSRRALDKLNKGKAQSLEDTLLGKKVAYWYHPGSKAAQEEGLTPVVFFHGISGTYGPSPAILLLRWWTGRPFFVPEFSYVNMRLEPPSTIRTRREMVAAVRGMLYRHGFTLESLDADESDDEEEWRKGKAVVVSHSLGAGAAAWLLRDAPDIVAGTVLIDPMSLLLFAADGSRNFFRSKARTSGEIFFKYFALERGIRHFISRHLKWTDAVILTTTAVAPLPPSAYSIIPRCAQDALHPPDDVPNYAPAISPYPSGPFPTIAFFAANDCILPIPKIKTYLESSGFDSKSLRILPNMDHAAILFRSGWLREVAKAINDVALAGEEVEKARWEEDESF